MVSSLFATSTPLLLHALLAGGFSADAAAAASAPAPSAAAMAEAAVLLPGQELKPGGAITAGSGFLIMETDGNLAVCATLDPAGTSCGSSLLWSSSTGGHPGAYVVMQQDGVLSVFPPTACKPSTDCRLWQSHTMAAAGCGAKSTNCSFVQIQKDGNVVMRKGGGPASAGAMLWNTATKIMPANVKNVLWMIAVRSPPYPPARRRLLAGVPRAGWGVRSQVLDLLSLQCTNKSCPWLCKRTTCART
jgi:hypothetical protein